MKSHTVNVLVSECRLSFLFIFFLVSVNSVMMNPFCPQVKNEGGRDIQAQLTLLALAVTYNSLHRGECQRRTISVTVPAHKGQELK